MNSNKVALKSGVIYAFATMINAALVFLTTPYFTRVMSKVSYGEYNNFLSWYNILQVLSLNLSATFISARQDFRDDVDSYIFSCAVLNFLLVGLCTPIVIVANNIWNVFSGFDWKILVILMIYVAFNQVFTMYQVNERFCFRYKFSSLLTIIAALSAAGLSMWLVHVLEDQMLARVIGLVLPIIFAGLISVVILYQRGKKNKVVYWKYAVPICLPYIPHLLSLTVLNSLDKTMIANMVGNAEVAIYSVAYTMGSIISLVVGILNNAFVPWLADRMSNNDISTINKFTKWYILFFDAVLVGVLLISPEILLILGGREYLDAINIVPAILVGCSLQLIYTMYVNVEQFYKKTKWMALISGISAIVNACLNYWLIPKYGFHIAAYTTLISYLVLAGGHIIIVRGLGYERLYSTKVVMTSIVISVMLVFACDILYNNDVTRFNIIIIYAGCAIFICKKNWKVIKGLIKKII